MLYRQRFLRPLDHEVAAKKPSDRFAFGSKRPFSRCVSLCIFHKLVFATSERKIADSSGGKRIRGVRPDRLISKNCSFIWEFTGRPLKNGHFSPVFGVFDPLDFEIGAKNAREMHIFSMLRLSLKYAFLKFGFLAKSFLAASDRKNADSRGGKKVRRVRPDRLVSKKCSFIWEFTGRSLKTEHFSPVFGVFDPLWLTSRLCRRPPGPPLRNCTRRPFSRKNAVSPRKFAGFRNPGSAHPLELFVFSFFLFFLSLCHGQ